MSRQDKALIVIVATGLAVGVAGWLKWRDRQFLEVAQRIDPCDEEAVVLYKTAALGRPGREERIGEGRVVAWRRNGRILSVLLVTPPSGTRPVAVSVRVEVDRERRPADEFQPVVLYEDASGLQQCK